MTRLVGVRAVCDVCSAARAVLFCVVHRHVSCVACDTTVHAVDPAAAQHQRVDLSCAVTALPFCEHCDKAPATSYCETEGTTLCDQCDDAVHRAKSCAAHEHRLISKALAQRTVSFTGLPPAAVADPPTGATHVRKTGMPHSPPRGRNRRRVVSSPMKRRSKRETVSPSSSEERSIDVAARGQQGQFGQQMHGVHPQQLGAQSVQSAPMPFREPSPATQTSVQQAQPPPGIAQDGQLAYMQAMALMAQREPSVDFFTGGMQGIFAPPDLITMSTDGGLMLDEGNPPPSTGTQRRYPTNIAPHPGVPSAAGRMSIPTQPEASTVAAAAAAATAAGEMFLLSAASSDQPSGSSDGLTPAFSALTSSPDAAGLAAAATAAAESTVAAIGVRTIRPSVREGSPNEINGEAFIVHHQRSNVGFEQQQAQAAEAQQQVQQRRLGKPTRRLRPEMDVLDDNPVMVHDIQRCNLFERTGQQFGDTHLNDGQDMRHGRRTDHLSNHHDGVTDFGGDDESHCPLTDFDIPRDDFGAFDALDLSSFEHNGVSNFGISSLRSTGRSMDDSDHNS